MPREKIASDDPDPPNNCQIDCCHAPEVAKVESLHVEEP